MLTLVLFKLQLVELGGVQMLISMSKEPDAALRVCLSDILFLLTREYCQFTTIDKKYTIMNISMYFWIIYGIESFYFIVEVLLHHHCYK